jgi:hypothetical protein
MNKKLQQMLEFNENKEDGRRDIDLLTINLDDDEFNEEIDELKLKEKEELLFPQHS